MRKSRGNRSILKAKPEKSVITQVISTFYFDDVTVKFKTQTDILHSEKNSATNTIKDLKKQNDKIGEMLFTDKKKRKET